MLQCWQLLCVATKVGIAHKTFLGDTHPPLCFKQKPEQCVFLKGAVFGIAVLFSGFDSCLLSAWKEMLFQSEPKSGNTLRHSGEYNWENAWRSATGQRVASVRRKTVRGGKEHFWLLTFSTTRGQEWPTIPYQSADTETTIKGQRQEIR